MYFEAEGWSLQKVGLPSLSPEDSNSQCVLYSLAQIPARPALWLLLVRCFARARGEVEKSFGVVSATTEKYLPGDSVFFASPSQFLFLQIPQLPGLLPLARCVGSLSGMGCAESLDWDQQNQLRKAVAELEQNGYAVIENALNAEQIARILKRSQEFVKERQHDDNFADAVSFSADFLDLVDVPEVLDVVSHWLGPNLYVNHSHVASRPAGSGASNSWHRNGGTEMPSSSFPMMMKVGFVLTDMTEDGMGNIDCVPLTREAEWGEIEGKEVIVNGDSLKLKAGSAMLFEQCWHAGGSNANNPNDRYVFYVQYARRILQPMDSAQYSGLREQSCTPVQQQLLMLPSDMEYMCNNRSCLYIAVANANYDPLPLRIQQEGRGVPFKERQEALPPAGYVKKMVPLSLLTQIEALTEVWPFFCAPP